MGFKVYAYLDAFQGGKERLIDIPNDAAPGACTISGLLELAFKYGQNDVQPVAGCGSVSVGDKIVLPDGGGEYEVKNAGFAKVERNRAQTLGRPYDQYRQ